MVTKVTIKQPKVMILETPEEWDKQREKRIKSREKLVKVELDRP